MDHLSAVFGCGNRINGSFEKLVLYKVKETDKWVIKTGYWINGSTRNAYRINE
jgi:hypothetical protein